MVLETKRLILREFIIADAPGMFALNNDPTVMRFTGDRPFESVETARNFLKNYTAHQKYGFGRWAVLTKANKKFIGWCGLKRNEEDQVDIGFRFFRKEWNKGYATESANACLHYGFEKLDLTEIVGRAHKENTASIRVLEKIGMTYWKAQEVEGMREAVYYRISKTPFSRV
ncbi:MAG: GNAT family N-acetyltransferase [Bacteroidota bacterium]